MKNIARLMLLMLAAGLMIVSVPACNDNATTRDIPAEKAAPAAAADDHAGHDHSGNDHAQQSVPGGTVIETMDSGGYSYVHLDLGPEKIWVAGPATGDIKIGEHLTFDGAMEMSNFHSKSLDRTFETILFVGGLYREGEESAAGNAHGGGQSAMGGVVNDPINDSEKPISGTKTVLDSEKVENVTKAAGGYTVAEVYAKASELADKEIKIRAKVVKFSPNIMGTNWMHVQDGSGGADDSDLTVTSDGHTQVGDLVMIVGKLSVDKDFGAGYRYHVIVEGATVTKE
ncbi:MAG: DNA-binding protein [bacterium]|nr:DNA-binding protein [bacterium]